MQVGRSIWIPFPRKRMLVSVLSAQPSAKLPQQKAVTHLVVYLPVPILDKNQAAAHCLLQELQVAKQSEISGKRGKS